MRKTIILLVTISLLASCSSFKNHMKQDMRTTDIKTISFELNKANMMMINVKNKGRELPFLFDTGSHSIYIYDSIMIANSPLAAKWKRKVFLPDMTIVETSERIFDFDIKILKSENIIVHSHVLSSPFTCIDLKYKGILGITTFITKDKGYLEDEKIVLLDFENSKITLLEEKEIVTKYKDYKEVNSKFHKILRNPYIYLKLKGMDEPIKFVFDTGFGSGIHIIKKHLPEVEKDSISEFVGSQVIYANNTLNLEKVPVTTNFNSEVTFMGEHITVASMSVSNIKKSNLLGMEFIKKYNWILDFENRKMYAMKNNLNAKPLYLTSKMYNKDYFVFEYKGKLLMISHKKGKNDYKLSDEIIAVDGTKITSDNMCYYLKELSKNKLSEFDIKIKKTKENELVFSNKKE